MTHAYPEIYLSNAQAMLGDAFDYAINVCHIPGSSFVKLFVASTISKRLENGEPRYLSGKSGIEVAMEILSETTGEAPDAAPQERFVRSREYWIGWAVAYYQWSSGRRYSDIFQELRCKRWFLPPNTYDCGSFVVRTLRMLRSLCPRMAAICRELNSRTAQRNSNPLLFSSNSARIRDK